MLQPVQVAGAGTIIHVSGLHLGGNQNEKMPVKVWEMGL
jgi:hypothetical protein